MSAQKFPHPLLSVVLALLISTCGQSPGPQTSQLDTLTKIQERGTLVVAIDPAYPPQSEIDPDGTRAPGTRCGVDQFTPGELRGFDVEVAAEIAGRLGVEACFVTPGWAQIIRGNWGGRWDISVGSMAITPQRMERLSFTQPYYSTPATFFVHRDNTSTSSPGDLSGKRIGTCSGCTYQSYLEGTLSLPGQEIDFLVENAEIIEVTTESTALQDLALGDGARLDAVLAAGPTGMRAMANGLPLKPLGDPVYREYLAAAVDKTGNSTSLVVKVSEIIQGMHSDGSLRDLSLRFYGEDLTENAAEFDISEIK
jgi:polar amino acid transport system substrate-binding protein